MALPLIGAAKGVGASVKSGLFGSSARSAATGFFAGDILSGGPSILPIGPGESSDNEVAGMDVEEGLLLAGGSALVVFIVLTLFGGD